MRFDCSQRYTIPYVKALISSATPTLWPYLSPVAMPSLFPFLRECSGPGLLETSCSTVEQVLQKPKADTRDWHCHCFYPQQGSSLLKASLYYSWGQPAMVRAGDVRLCTAPVGRQIPPWAQHDLTRQGQLQALVSNPPPTRVSSQPLGTGELCTFCFLCHSNKHHA